MPAPRPVPGRGHPALFPAAPRRTSEQSRKWPNGGLGGERGAGLIAQEAHAGEGAGGRRVTLGGRPAGPGRGRGALLACAVGAGAPQGLGLSGHLASEGRRKARPAACVWWEGPGKENSFPTDRKLCAVALCPGARWALCPG